MKILQLGKFYPVKGGIEKVMFDIMTGLAARGIDCDMMCAESVGGGSIRDIIPHARLITLRTWLKAASTTIAPSMTLLLRKIAADYDIIHIHHPDPMAALALRFSGFRGKVVLHWHSDIVKQKKLFRLIAPLQKWLIERADIVVGTSPTYLRNSVYLRQAATKSVCMPIGIKPVVPDLKGAERLRTLYPGKKIIFFLGRLIPYKGLPYLIDAAAYFPDDYMMLIGGEGPLHESLHARIESVGLQSRVVLLGKIPQDELPAYYTACDLFCLPSVMKSEAFGIVQIEAMSLGKPVVATEIEGSGTSWVNADGVSGLNVPVRDSRALSEAIMEILSDSERYASFSIGARERFDSLFRIDRMIDNCVDLYTRILEK